MSDFVNSTGAVSNALRQPATLVSVNNIQNATQKFFDLVNNGARPTTVQPGEKPAGSSKGGNLPRGSFVDVLV